MDIKEAISNILHKHNQVNNGLNLQDNSNNDDKSHYTQKENNINQNKEKLYQHFEDNFHHIVDDLPPDYWRNHFKKNTRNAPTKENKISKKGQFYLHYGMRVNLKNKTEEALAIIELMHIVRKEHTKNDIFDKMADIKIHEEKIKNSKNSGLISMINDIASSGDDGEGSSDQELEKSVLLEKKPEEIDMTKHLRLEELYIQSVAVSLLAESDGNCAIAKEILHNGGMDAIKKMDVSSLKSILDQLNDVVVSEYGIGH